MKRKSHLIIFIVIYCLISYNTFAIPPDGQNPNNKAPVVDCNSDLAFRMLEVIEQDILPLTSEGVKIGNKVFGAALIKKSDQSLVLAATNNETENPLWHGEVHLLKLFYEMPEAERPDPKEMIFIATHEPCPLCLSAITWGGYDAFYYLFSYEDSRDEFNIPHDLRILKEVFKQDAGGYAHNNYYWDSFKIADLIEACQSNVQLEYQQKVTELKQDYDKLSEIYQSNKDKVNMPLK